MGWSGIYAAELFYVSFLLTGSLSKDLCTIYVARLLHRPLGVMISNSHYIQLSIHFLSFKILRLALVSH